MKKSKCSPAIYKKLSPEAKKLWDKLYNDFLWEIKDLFESTNQLNIEIISHNLACHAAWAFEGKEAITFANKKRQFKTATTNKK